MNLLIMNLQRTSTVIMLYVTVSGVFTMPAPLTLSQTFITYTKAYYNNFLARLLGLPWWLRW